MKLEHIVREIQAGPPLALAVVMIALGLAGLCVAIDGSSRSRAMRRARREQAAMRDFAVASRAKLARQGESAESAEGAACGEGGHCHE